MQIYVALIALAMSAGTGFGTAWHIQSLRAEAHEKHSIEVAAEQERKLHAVEQASRDAVIAAQNAARTREAKLRSDADSARRALNGLRTATEGAVSYAATSPEACVVAVDTSSELLNQCSGEYRELAEKADRHVSDLQTLMDAWPHQ